MRTGFLKLQSANLIFFINLAKKLLTRVDFGHNMLGMQSKQVQFNLFATIAWWKRAII